MPSILYVAERGKPAFQTARLSADVVCAGDSITGWNNSADLKLHNEHFGDELHPNDDGAQVIAQEVYRSIAGFTSLSQ